MKTLTYVNTALILFAIILIVAGMIRQPVAQFSGVTNLDSLTLSDNLIVTGTSTLSANLNADGGMIVGGVKDYGESASRALTASDICDYNIIQIDADGSGDDVGASISFPDDETLQADCLGSSGDYKKFFIDGTSSTSTTYIEIVGPDIVEYASTAATTDIAGNVLIQAEVFNTGTSLSWYFDVIDASVSYQLND